MRILARIALVCYIITSIGTTGPISQDTSAHLPAKVQQAPPPVVPPEKETRFPPLQDRLMTLGIVLVVFGGLGLILYLKRAQADKDAEI